MSVSLRGAYDGAAVLRTYKGAGVLFYADVHGDRYVLLGHLQYGGPPEGPRPWSAIGGTRDPRDAGPADTAARAAGEEVGETVGLTRAQIRQALGEGRGVHTVHNEQTHYVMFLAPIAHGPYPAAFAPQAPSQGRLGALRWYKVRWGRPLCVDALGTALTSMCGSSGMCMQVAYRRFAYSFMRSLST